MCKKAHRMNKCRYENFIWKGLIYGLLVVKRDKEGSSCNVYSGNAARLYPVLSKIVVYILQPLQQTHMEFWREIMSTNFVRRILICSEGQTYGRKEPLKLYTQNKRKSAYRIRSIFWTHLQLSVATVCLLASPCLCVCMSVCNDLRTAEHTFIKFDGDFFLKLFDKCKFGWNYSDEYFSPHEGLWVYARWSDGNFSIVNFAASHATRLGNPPRWRYHQAIQASSHA